VQEFEDGDEEREGFTAPGFCGTDEVFPREEGGDGLGLDLCHAGEAQAC